MIPYSTKDTVKWLQPEHETPEVMKAAKATIKKEAKMSVFPVAQHFSGMSALSITLWKSRLAE